MRAGDDIKQGLTRVPAREKPSQKNEATYLRWSLALLVECSGAIPMPRQFYLPRTLKLIFLEPGFAPFNLLETNLTVALNQL